MKGYILDRFISTFRETSYDKINNTSLIGECKKKVINFDSLTSLLCKEYRAGENLSSADVLALSLGKVLFIEFKNQSFSSLNSRVIQKKVFDTPYIFSFLSGMESVDWNTFKKKMVFILLYRDDDIPSWNKFSKEIERLSKKKNIPLGLEKYKELYSEIRVEKADDFIKSDYFKNIK